MKISGFLIPILFLGIINPAKGKPAPKKQTVKCDVLVVGGGCAGVCAAIQSARLGVNTVLVEHTPWLGGMLTTAGVSATDGNHFLPTGLWGEFRQKLYDHYGGASTVNTGWVSYTLFEPGVGNNIFHQIVDAETSLSLYHGYRPVTVIKEGNKVTGAVFHNENGDELTVYATISIGADETGDFMKMAGVPYRIGVEARSETGEPGASPVALDIIQDLTYVAILKDFGEGMDKTIPEPPGYDPDKYNCTCQEVCDSSAPHSCNQMFNYGKLPNGKFMINWPVNGNDYYLNILEMTPEEREAALVAAKNHTLGWIYFMQTVGGYSHYGIAEGEYPTTDSLPFYPYHRESRRMEGLVMFRIQDILDPYGTPSGDLYKTGISVGDYPVDHHHGKSPVPISESFPKIPSFAVPYGTLIPKVTDGLLVCEKSHSVTHMVNGCTRLQPCVMATGQAAGAAAAISVLENAQPRNIPLRNLQQTLLDANAWCLPFVDVPVGRWSFQEVQRIGLAGVMKGTGVPSGWANKTYFYPENEVSEIRASQIFAASIGKDEITTLSLELTKDESISREKAVQAVHELTGSPSPQHMTPYFTDVPEDHEYFDAIQVAKEAGWLDGWADTSSFAPDQAILREELAAMLDRALDPFNNLPVEIVPAPRVVKGIDVLTPSWKRHNDPGVENVSTPPPDWFPSDLDNNRSMAYNHKTNHLLITDNLNKTIHIINADTGQDEGVLDSSVIVDDILPVASIVVDDDGVIYAAPYASAPFKIYRWENEASIPTTVFSENITWNCGRAMDITGTGANSRLYVTAANDDGRFMILDTVDGVNFASREWVTAGNAGMVSGYGLFAIAAFSETEMFGTGRGTQLFRFYRDGSGWHLDEEFSPVGFPANQLSAMRFIPEQDILVALAFDPVDYQTSEGLFFSDTGGVIFKWNKARDGFEALAAGKVEESFTSGNAAGGIGYDKLRGRLFVSFSKNGFAAFGAPQVKAPLPSGWMLR